MQMLLPEQGQEPLLSPCERRDGRGVERRDELAELNWRLRVVLALELDRE